MLYAVVGLIVPVSVYESQVSLVFCGIYTYRKTKSCDEITHDIIQIEQGKRSCLASESRIIFTREVHSGHHQVRILYTFFFSRGSNIESLYA